MKVVKSNPTKSKKSKNKKLPNYSSWDAFTQARYLLDLHKQLGNGISMKTAYHVALLAVDTSRDI